MLKILNEDNFTAADLQYLYQVVVVGTFNNNHSANNNDRNVFNFFENKVKSYFRPIINDYNGVAYFEKLLIIIQEIRSKILTNILMSLDDTSSINPLGHIDSTIKSNIKSIINEHKDQLQKIEFDCKFCEEFRRLINQILGNIDKFSINQLNTNPWLAAWRFLDPANNRRECEKNDFNAPYINNPLSFSITGELLSCNVRVKNFTNATYDYGGYLLEAIVVYYLATKFSHTGTLLSKEEQERRFIIYTTTLTEALRCYNENDFQGVDLPSCPGGMISRFIEQCGYEKNLQFVSQRTFINDVISDVVCNRVHEILSKFTTIQEILDLLNFLCTGFSPYEQLGMLETSLELRKKRYSLFDFDNNNKIFFELIKNKIKEKTDNIEDEVMFDFHQRIREYCYQEFTSTFLDLPIIYPDRIIEKFTRGFRLIGYAFSDPSYCCYPRVLNMCLAKLQQLQPQSQIISGKNAIKLCEQVLKEVLPLAANLPLFASGFMDADLAVIIESYKNGVNNKESDQDFVDRIIKISYQDYSELGEQQEMAGLSSIINSSLLNRNVLIKNIASRVLEKIRKHLNLEQVIAEQDPLLEEQPYQILLDIIPEDYSIKNKAYIDIHHRMYTHKLDSSLVAEAREDILPEEASNSASSSIKMLCL